MRKVGVHGQFEWVWRAKQSGKVHTTESVRQLSHNVFPPCISVVPRNQIGAVRRTLTLTEGLAESFFGP